MNESWCVSSPSQPVQQRQTKSHKWRFWIRSWRVDCTAPTNKCKHSPAWARASHSLYGVRVTPTAPKRMHWREFWQHSLSEHSLNVEKSFPHAILYILREWERERVRERGRMKWCEQTLRRSRLAASPCLFLASCFILGSQTSEFYSFFSFFFFWFLLFMKRANTNNSTALPKLTFTLTFYHITTKIQQHLAVPQFPNNFKFRNNCSSWSPA